MKRSPTRFRPAVVLASVVLAALVIWAVMHEARAPSSATPADLVVESRAGPRLEALDAGPSIDGRVPLAAAASRVGDLPLSLTLVRALDGALVANVPLEVEPRDALAVDSDWLATDARGAIDLTLDAEVTSFALRVAGFESKQVDVLAARNERRVELALSSGIFGRVVDAQGLPVVGAEVTLKRFSRRLTHFRAATRAAPDARLDEHEQIVATTRSGAGGFYFVACDTGGASVDRVSLRAIDGSASGRLDVELPRAPIALPDLVLAKACQLAVHVIDTNAEPVPDALVTPIVDRRPREPLRADASGKVLCAASEFPLTFFARADGMQLVAIRLDGKSSDDNPSVASCETRVELVLAPAPSVRVRAVDAVTRHPLFLASVLVEFMRGGKQVHRARHDVDKHGEALISLSVGSVRGDASNRPGSSGDGDEPPDTARFSISSRASYSSAPLFELDLRAALPKQTIELAVEPADSASNVFRGRVVRAGEAVAHQQLGLDVQSVSEPARRDYLRVYTDAEGRFSARWTSASGPALVTVFPHMARWDEFGFIGPLTESEAQSGEHVLELKPAGLVPAILRGVTRGGSYRYYVHLIAQGVSVSTTINGAPITIDRDGEARVMLELPADRAARVTIGYVNAGYAKSNACEPVDYVPGTRAPLVFELEPLFASIQGRAVGFAPDELSRLRVAFAGANDDEARARACGRDGTFRLDGVPRGRGAVLLVLEGQNGVTVIARRELDLRGDVDGLQLTRDPSSLPTQADQQR